MLQTFFAVIIAALIRIVSVSRNVSVAPALSLKSSMMKVRSLSRKSCLLVMFSHVPTIRIALMNSSVLMVAAGRVAYLIGTAL